MPVFDPAGELVARLAEKKLTVATAESCTGGMAAQYITSIPGASAVFECGIVSYANRVKIRQLGVSPDTLERYGAVSEPVAREMAQGVTRAAESDLGLSATGIAGPSGGVPGKPVGTVHIAVWSRWGCLHERLDIGPVCGFDRDTIRRETVRRMFGLALRALREWEGQIAGEKELETL